MNKMIDINVELNDKFIEPSVTIHAKSRDEQVENIIDAIENATESEFPLITGYRDGTAEFISQRDIIRVYINNRKIIVETEDGLYHAKLNLTALEEVLNSNRFVRISQSEIINMYKVKCFEFSFAGTIGVEMLNGKTTWVARSRVKAIKGMIDKKNK